MKIQKPNIAYQMPVDLLCYRVLVYLFDKAFDLPLYWTVADIEHNITAEADFVREADNLEKATTDLAPLGARVYVPRVYRAYSTKKVLTMEWIDGVKVSRGRPWSGLSWGYDDCVASSLRVDIYCHHI